MKISRKEYLARYYQKHKSKMDERTISWYRNNKEKKKLFNKNYRAKLKRELRQK